MDKAVVVFSGGADSTTSLAMAVRKLGKENVIALTFTYGQSHSVEINNAIAIAKHYGVEHIIRDMSEVYQTNQDCALLAHNHDKAEARGSLTQSYKEKSVESNNTPIDTYVPFRNGLMLSYAAAIALEYKASEIHYGSHRSDAANNAYPDCSESFNEAMNHAIFEGTGRQVRIVNHLISLEKDEVIAWGLANDVPYHLTWSCYEPKFKEDGSAISCGVCASCQKRIVSFVVNGVEDPIEYYDDKYNKVG